MVNIEKTQVEIQPGRVITIETGKLAKQAGGSALVSIGDTVVLVTVCGGSQVSGDFFPLTVEYREKAYSNGKIPGGFLKREARPSDQEILTARMIDRPIRPLFPNGYRREVQVVASVLSYDDQNDTESISVIGASVALGLSSLPIKEQVACVKVVRVSRKFIVNPTISEVESSDLEMVVAGSASSILMVEGGSYEVSEEEVVQGIAEAHQVIKKMVVAQNELVKKVGLPKEEFISVPTNEGLQKEVESIIIKPLQELLSKALTKEEYYTSMANLKADLHEKLDEKYEEEISQIDSFFGELQKREMRELILNGKNRIDGRDTKTIRPLFLEINILPCTHGSALFQRGETQAIVTCTLGNKQDEQRVETIRGSFSKNYFLHYNFPPFSVGEAGRMTGVSRREVGHGHLAERSLEPVLPTLDCFPYTIRLVSEVLESNGSSSMASVCGGSMALMATGVPIKSAVAGIAMGLISDGSRMAILSDITGTEDHLGDMDFKVTGTSEGVTAFQMDIKIEGITSEIMLNALKQAKAGREHILLAMNKVIPKPLELSEKAPSVIKMNVPIDKIRELIGPGGKMIRQIEEKSGGTLNISDNGEVIVAGKKKENSLMAKKMIDELFAQIEIGKIYQGKIKNITTFGVFVEALPNKEGLVHISQLDLQGEESVGKVFSVGDHLEVKCINIDPKGRVQLSQIALKEKSSTEDKKES